MALSENYQGPVFTEETDCQDCYKCLRRCPVKAIKINNHRASVIPESCIYCGACITNCPAKAKKARNDVPLARTLIRKSERAVLSLAPSWASEFTDIESADLISNLKQLGFSHVSETAVGAEVLSDQIKQFLVTAEDGVYISPACPTVVALIQKHYPALVGNILPFKSPVEIHAKMLKNHFGDDTSVVFAGPCLSKKYEADHLDSSIDAAITFIGLQKWLTTDSRSREPKECTNPERVFSPFQAHEGRLYPVDGGMIRGVKQGATVTDTDCMSFSGIDNCMRILEELQENPPKGKIFLELMACEGGCINGPGVTHKSSLLNGRVDVISSMEIPDSESKEEECTEVLITSQEVRKCYTNDEELVYHSPSFSEKDIVDTLSSINKFSDKDELNCGGCGYSSCRDLCKALLAGSAEREMCVSYMRQVANNKSTVLLQKIPYGVVMTDEHLRIIESNHIFAQMMSEDTQQLWEASPGLQGADLSKIAPFYNHFSSLLNSGAESFETFLRYENQLYRLSVFTIQKHKIVCGIIHDLNDPATRQEEVVKRARQVIHENLSTVQQVAYLLGENASKTEAMLNSIVESFNSDNTDGTS